MSTVCIDPRLYEAFHRLVAIRIGGQTYRVPENNPLLRCFQFLDMNCLQYGQFCWNADCRTCVVNILEGAPDGPGAYLACQTQPVEGMCVEAAPRGVTLPPPDRVQVYRGINDRRPEEAGRRRE
ncbi:MAG: 2Fe-2S iron-sulfur cluster binding domain-containing protein [Acidobacteriota bacterium]